MLIECKFCGAQNIIFPGESIPKGWKRNRTDYGFEYWCPRCAKEIVDNVYAMAGYRRKEKKR